MEAENLRWKLKITYTWKGESSSKPSFWGVPCWFSGDVLHVTNLWSFFGVTDRIPDRRRWSFYRSVLGLTWVSWNVEVDRVEMLKGFLKFCVFFSLIVNPCMMSFNSILGSLYLGNCYLDLTRKMWFGDFKATTRVRVKNASSRLCAKSHEFPFFFNKDSHRFVSRETYLLRQNPWKF